MSRTVITSQVLQSYPLTGIILDDSLDVIWADADPVNGNSFQPSGRDLLLAYYGGTNPSATLSFGSSVSPAVPSVVIFKLNTPGAANTGYTITFDTTTVGIPTLTSATALVLHVGGATSPTSVASITVNQLLAYFPFNNGAWTATLVSGTGNDLVSNKATSLYVFGASTLQIQAAAVGDAFNAVTVTIDASTIAAPTIVGNDVTFHTMGQTVAQLVTAYPTVTVTAGVLNLTLAGPGTDVTTSQSLAALGTTTVLGSILGTPPASATSLTGGANAPALTGGATVLGIPSVPDENGRLGNVEYNVYGGKVAQFLITGPLYTFADGVHLDSSTSDLKLAIIKI